MDETTTRSYRLTEEVHKKIKEIAEEIGGNQQQTISKLIEAYELQKGKIVLADKKSDIETFENHINALTRIYMGSLEDNHNATELARTEFDAQLISKDNVIQDLQQQLADAKETEQQAVANADALQTENQRLNDCIDKLQSESETKISDLQNMLSDKEKLNTALAETIEQQKLQIAGMEEKINEVKTLKADVIKYQNELQDMKKDMEQQQLQHEKDILALEKKLQDEKTAEIIKYQELYLEIIKKKESTTTKNRKPSSAKKESELG